MYTDTVFAFYGYVDFLTNFYCLVGFLSMIVWTHAVLGVLHACGFFFVLFCFVLFCFVLFCFVFCLFVWLVGFFFGFFFVLYLHMFSAIEHVSHGKAL